MSRDYKSSICKIKITSIFFGITYIQFHYHIRCIQLLYIENEFNYTFCCSSAEWQTRSFRRNKPLHTCHIRTVQIPTTVSFIPIDKLAIQAKPFRQSFSQSTPHSAANVAAAIITSLAMSRSLNLTNPHCHLSIQLTVNFFSIPQHHSN